MNLTLDISSVMRSGLRRVASRDGGLVALRAGAGAEIRAHKLAMVSLRRRGQSSAPLG
jgi:hypothetical protein